MVGWLVCSSPYFSYLSTVARISNTCNQIKLEKICFSFLNYRKSLIFTSQLQNRVSSLLQLSKIFVLPPFTILQAIFTFLIDFLPSLFSLN